MNDRIDIIARRVLGWKLNRWDRWYDHEKNVFIHESEFQPDQNIEHAMIIVETLQKFGFTYQSKGEYEVCFNEICATGATLAQAITNAAYEIADVSSIDDAWLVE